MTILIAIGLTILVIAFVSSPLFKGREVEEWGESKEEREREELLSQKAATYAAIKDLDFDYQMGKLSDEDYRELRERYRGKAISILKRIDELGRAGDIEERIEREVLEIRPSD